MQLSQLYATSQALRDTGLGIVRIVLAIFMIYHGWEVFDKAKMNEYTKWMIDLKLFAPAFMAYLGKTIELVAGICLLIGWLTRIVVIPLAFTMLFISFIIGQGRIFVEEQHPFLFALFCLLYFFTGAGRWSVDALLAKKYVRPRPDKL